MKEDIIDIKEEKNFKLTPRTLSKLSLIINKMGVSQLILELNEESDDPEKDKKIIVKKLLSLIINNLYKAEDEIIDLVAETMKITKEEAADVDIIPFVKQIFNDQRIFDFLK